MSGSERRESIDELLAAYLEGELDGDGLRQVEDHLRDSPEDLTEIAFHRAMARQLAEVPLEEAPADFHLRVMEQATGVPGSWTHRIELALTQLMRPALVTAAALAARARD